MYSLSRLLPWQRQRAELRRQGFTSDQIDKLLAYRSAYRSGEFTDDLPADHHLVFGRWLARHGKISG